MARKYRVTVNGKAYDVDVEEMGAGAPAAALPTANCQAGTTGCIGRSASWREGRSSHKIKNWGWRVIDLPAPIAACFARTKGSSDFAMLTCIALGIFLSDRRHASGDCLCKEPCCFFFVGAADENFAAVDEMEGIAHKRKDFRGVYPKALVAVDKGMPLQSG